MSATELSEKQKRFVKEYVIDMNAIQATIRAGYSSKSAACQSARLINNDKIKKEIAYEIKKRNTKTEITAERVLIELARLGFSNIKNAVTWDEEGNQKVIASDKMDEDTLRAIQEITFTRNREGDKSIKVKLAPKQPALDSLAKHLGMYIQKIEHTGRDGGPIETTDPKNDLRSLLSDIANRIAGGKNKDNNN